MVWNGFHLHLWDPTSWSPVAGLAVMAAVLALLSHAWIAVRLGVVDSSDQAQYPGSACHSVRCLSCRGAQRG